MTRHNYLVVLTAALVVFAGFISATKMGAWMMTRDAVEDRETMRITIHLKQSNLDVLDRTFNVVTAPDSPDYGKYLSMDEITAIVAPSSATIDAVTSWLKNNGADRIDVVNNKDVIKAYMPKKFVEKSFNVQIKRFESYNGKIIFRSLEKHTIPVEIAQHVDLIQGISDYPLFPRKRAMKYAKTTDATKPGSPIPGTAQIVAAGSRGGNPVISVAYNIICLNGQYSTTTVPCANDKPVTNVYLTGRAVNFDVVPKSYGNGGVNPSGCSIDDNGRTLCKATMNVDYYVPVNVSLMLVFATNNNGPTTYNAHPVVATLAVVPQSINSQYAIPQSWQPLQPSALSQAVVEFEQQYYSPSDLQLFFDAMGILNTAQVTVIGPNDVANPGVEANLDIQYMMGLAPSVPTTYWSIAANSTVEIDDILQWAVAMSNTANPPIVNSLSYGMSERNVDTYLGKGYIMRSDIEFKKLALRGITIIIADGDTGAGDLGDPPMSVPSCLKALNPDWPSQSPYVTAVGSTYFSPNAEPICYYPARQGGINCNANPLGEVGVSLDDGINWTTGGGFSNVQPRADYQRLVVEQYLTAHADLLPPPSAFNRSGRAYPDVATVGHNLMVAYQGQFIGVDGTSASAPIFGGIVSLLNDVRVRNGKSVLGFLNPLLYKIAAKNAAAFRDVVVGQNRCGSYDATPNCCAFGYYAVPGWDPMTGLGSPNFELLAQEILKY